MSHTDIPEHVLTAKMAPNKSVKRAAEHRVGEQPQRGRSDNTVAHGSGLRPITVSPRRASELSGLSLAKIWLLIGDGTLASTKVGARRLVRFNSLEALLLGGDAG
jgi:hypothetical protein